MEVQFNYPLKIFMLVLEYYFRRLLGGSGSPINPKLEVLTIMVEKTIKHNPILFKVNFEGFLNFILTLLSSWVLIVVSVIKLL